MRTIPRKIIIIKVGLIEQAAQVNIQDPPFLQRVQVEFHLVDSPGGQNRRGAADQGHGKVEQGHRWGRRKLNGVTNGTTGKRLAGLHFYLYRTRIGSHI